MISFDLTSALSLLPKNLSFLTSTIRLWPKYIGVFPSAFSLKSKYLSFLTSAFSLNPFYLISFNLSFSLQSKPLKTIILTVLAAISLSSCSTPDPVPPMVIGGHIDLHKWDFENHGPVKLDGDWKFVWNRLIGPNNSQEIDDYIHVPKNWKHETRSGINITPEGYGTYALTIRTSKSEKPYALYVPMISHACMIWVNEKLVYQAGVVAKDRVTMKPATSKDVLVVEAYETEIRILMQVSNFVHHIGGIDHSFLFGPKHQIKHLRIKNVSFEAFLTGGLVFTAILYIMIAVLFNKKRAAILFSLICFDIVFLNLVNGENILPYLLPSLPWSIKIKIDFLSAFALPIPLIAAFIYDLFPRPRTKPILILILGIGLLNAIFIISAPVHTFSRFLTAFEVLLLVQCIYMAYLLLVAIYNSMQGSLVIFLGGLVLLASAINDILYYEQIVSVGPLAIMGFWFFLFSQAFAYAIQFMSNYNKLERFSENLEWQVNERTRNLQKTNEKLQEEIKSKEDIEEKLRTLSQTDPLTKIDNRYKFNETLDEEIRRVNRYQESLSVIMFDIDHFKLVNDTYGHDVGDRVLVNVAQLVENMIRDIDSFARWGGEEFVILTPNNDIEGASMLAERIRKTIELTDFSPVSVLTASFGVIEYVKGEDKTSFLKRVDEALYSAKYRGRNQVVRNDE